MLKRTQKAREDELTVGRPAALNGCSSEILYLLDSAQGLCIPEGNIGRRLKGEWRSEARSRRPIRARHHVKQATSETLKFLIRVWQPVTAIRVCPRSGISDDDK